MKQSFVLAAALAGSVVVTSRGARAEAGVAPPPDPCASTTLELAPPEKAVIPINAPALPIQMRSPYPQFRDVWSVTVGDLVGPGGVSVYHVDSKENDVTLVAPIGPTEGEQTLKVSAACQPDSFSSDEAGGELHFSFGPEVAFPKTIGTVDKQFNTHAEIPLTDEAFAFLPVTKVWVEIAGYHLTEDSFYGELPPDISLYDHVLVVRAPVALQRFCTGPGTITLKPELHFDIAGTTDDPAPLRETIPYVCPTTSNAPPEAVVPPVPIADAGASPNVYDANDVGTSSQHGCACIIVGREASTGAAAASIAIGALALVRRRRRS